jgi:asparagine synthase (glutamine-hydrolysing)
VSLDLEHTVPRVVALLDEPCADPAAVPGHLVARAASEHVTVLLSGTGGDELFGGYRRHRLPELLKWLAPLPRSLAGAGARWLGDRDHHRRTAAGERLVMLRKLLEARARTPFLSAYLSAFEPAPPPRWRESLALDVDPGAVCARLASELAAEWGAPANDEALVLAVDHLWYLPDDLLLKEDRTTMGASVEGRVPYLDDTLVRHAATLPRSARFAEPDGKAVLRVLARRTLPEPVARRRKHGFSVPVEDWLRGPLDSLAGDVFATSGSGVFHAPVLRRWHDEHRRGIDRSGALWAALTFELWWRAVGAAPPASLAASGRPLRPSRVTAGVA